MASNSLKWIHLVSSRVGQQPFIDELHHPSKLRAVLPRADWIVIACL